jgi:L-ascorbate metabolism protein UlaG (beta-lactamase superfamily)
MHAPVTLSSVRSRAIREAVGAVAVAASLCSCAGPAYRGPVSPHFDGVLFHNDPTTPVVDFGDVFRWQSRANPTPWPDWVETPAPTKPAPKAQPGEIAVTFVNHSTLLVQTGDLNILTDPVWSYRVGPVAWLGPRRHHAPGIRFEDLPRIDAVVLSHDHFDHMDLPTLRTLIARDNPVVFAGLGNETNLAETVPRLVTLDWWQCRPLGKGRICALPAQHNSRRGLFDSNRTLWVSYWIESPAGSVFFAGDTGLGPHFARIRERMGAPCVALLPIGAYWPRWFMAVNHMSPADAVEAHDTLGAQVSIAMHFGTFQQSDEGRDDPARDLALALATGSHAPFYAPSVGEERAVRCPR